MTADIPHNPEMEQGTLGAVLISPDEYFTIAWLKPEHFHIHKNRYIWEAMTALVERQSAIDVLTVHDELERMGRGNDVSAGYVTGLINTFPYSYNAEHYAKSVLDYAQRRNDIQIANMIASSAYTQGGLDRAHVIDLLTKNTSAKSGALPIGGLLNDFYSELEARAKNPKEVWGISTGIPSVDKKTGGLHPQQTTMLAGAPAVGKTTLLLQMMLEAAKHGTRTAIYELEMDANRLIGRIVSMLTNVPIRNMKTGKMEKHWESLTNGIELLEKMPIYICDNPMMSTSDIRADVAKQKSLHGLALVGLDYLNLLTDHESTDDDKNTTAKARRFRQICREFNVSGVSVQSITKEGMKALVPHLADMSGPAEVGFAADNIFFLVGDTGNEEKFSLLPAKLRDGDTDRKPISLSKPKGKIMFAEPTRY